MTLHQQHPRLSSRTRRTGLPFLGVAALLLASGQTLVAQSLPPPSTWQSSPVLSKFKTELRAPGQIPVALPDDTRSYLGGTVIADHYTIDINEYKDKLHPALPPTTLWGYHPTVTLGGFPQAHLGGIIIAQRGEADPDHLPQQPAPQAHPPGR